MARRSATQKRHKVNSKPRKVDKSWDGLTPTQTKKKLNKAMKHLSVKYKTF